MTLGEFYTRIRDYLTDTDTAVLTNERICEVLNEKTKEAARRRNLYVTQTSGTISVTAGTTGPYSAPTGLVEVYTVTHAGDDGGTVIVNPATKSAVDEVIAGRTDTGELELYAIWGDEFTFAPTPGSDYTVTVTGTYYPGDLVHTATSSTNTFLTNAEQYCLWAVLAELSLFDFEDGRHSIWALKAERELNHLHGLTRRRQVSGGQLTSRWGA